MSNLNISKKPKKITKKKEPTESTIITDIKSIKIPEKFEEKEKLLQTLKHSVADLDIQLKNLRSKREYYMELVEILEKEVQERRELYYKTDKNDQMSIIKEELYNEYKLLEDNQQQEMSFVECPPSFEQYAPNVQEELNQSLGIVESNRKECVVISEERNNFAECDHEAFNDMEQGEGLFTQFNYVPADDHLEDRFKVLTMRPKQEKNSELKSEKKMITKEYFSQQINSLGQVSNSDNEINKICQGFTAKPDYNQLGEEKLKDECRKYGIKPGSNKAMIKQLNEIWDFIHKGVLPEKLKNDLTNFLLPQEVESNAESKRKNVATIEGKLDKIVSIIIEEKELWERIIQFKKVTMKEVKAVLNKKDLIIENEILRDQLLNMGVVLGD